MSFGDIDEEDIDLAIEEAKKEGGYVNSSNQGSDDFLKRVLCKLLSFRTKSEDERHKLK